MIVVGPSTDHEKILKWAETTFRRAERAGIRYIVFGSGKSRKVPDGFSRETAEEQFVRLCKRLGPVAARYRVTVVIEPLNSRETNLINSVSEGASIVERVNHKNIRLLCDLFHMTADGEPPQAIVDARKAYPALPHRRSRRTDGPRHRRGRFSSLPARAEKNRLQRLRIDRMHVERFRSATADGCRGAPQTNERLITETTNLKRS